MKLFIENNTLVEDVKKIFTSCYPFLRIELYKKPYDRNRINAKKESLTSALHLDKYIQMSGKTVIDLDNRLTVSDLETQFAVIGLTAEVFRKSGNVWIETSLTNSWTLRQQNMEGEEISRHFKDTKSVYLCPS